MGAGLTRKEFLEVCDAAGFVASTDARIPSDLLPDVILGAIYSCILILLFIFECRNKRMAKITGQYSHGKGDLMRFYHWGWASMILSFLTALGQVFITMIFNLTGANCESFFAEKINQTTGITNIMAKFCAYTTQLYRLKSFFGGDRHVNKLAYPPIVFIVVLLFIWALMLFYGLYWYIFIFYCGNCAPVALFLDGNKWFLPSLIGNDVFWFITLFGLFAFKIWQLSNIVAQQDGNSEEGVLVRKRLNRSLQAVFTVGFISNIVSVVMYSIGNIEKLLGYLGEFAMTDGLVTSFCIMLMFEHNQYLLKKVYLFVVGSVCCWNIDKVNKVSNELSYDPRTQATETTHDVTEGQTSTDI